MSKFTTIYFTEDFDFCAEDVGYYEKAIDAEIALVGNNAVNIYATDGATIQAFIDLIDESYIEEIPNDPRYIEGALAAGIPRSVIEGKTKLRDHFSKEYIDYKCNKKAKGDTNV